MDFLLDANNNDEYQYVDDYGSQEADQLDLGATASTTKSLESEEEHT